MQASRRLKMGALSLVLALPLALPVRAQTPPPEPPDPTPDPTYGNLFYGSVPPNGATAPVLVFIPGLFGSASSWWGVGNNDMYAYAYQAGYRTAFISPNRLNLPSTGGIEPDGKVIESVFPALLKHYQVTQVYMISHSKGGLDLQYALANAKFRGYAKAVFTLASPNQGDALADWCYSTFSSVCSTAGLLIPAIHDMQTSIVSKYRSQWDPLFQSSGIPFYTVAGNTFTGNTLTDITGPIILLVTGFQTNDGILTLAESVLPSNYAVQLAVLNNNHFDVPQGHNSWPIMAPLLSAP